MGVGTVGGKMVGADVDGTVGEAVGAGEQATGEGAAVGQFCRLHEVTPMGF